MTGSPRVLIDLDDTVADWSSGWYRWIVDYLRTRPELGLAPIHPADQQSWSALAGYPEALRPAIHAAIYRPGFFRELAPIRGAVAGVQALADSGADVWFCSSPIHPHRTSPTEKYDWVAETFGALWAGRLILASDKTLISGTWLIDDRPAVAGSAVASWEQILFGPDRPWNTRSPQRRMRSWSEQEVEALITLVWAKAQ